MRELNANYPELGIDLAVDMSHVLERRLRARTGPGDPGRRHRRQRHRVGSAGHLPGVAAIPSLFVAGLLDSGEFTELPVQPVPPSIIVSMWLHGNAEMLVHAAANTARLSCANYCAQIEARYIEALH